MSKRCSINKSKGVLVGNKVSHSNRKSKKRFLPNLQIMSFFSEILKKTIRLKLTPGSIRTIEHNDGIDQYIMTTAAKDLTDEASKLRKQMKKASAA
ncbi:MAG: 50S ribosomal protein L28 [Alphaproteobacteria bacterium]|jgi:large subunit ribosomal protein L28|nr:50S ribosomal protein L28 [Candidatus Jidaibacter sp.]